MSVFMRERPGLSRERFHAGPATGQGADKPPLLFIHGAFAAGACWDIHMLPWFAKAGYHAHAFSLRGHGSSAGNAGLDNFGLDDYLSDVMDEIDRMDRPPVLVGHSMGGWLAMRAAIERDLAGVALLCPVPPFGLAAANVSLFTFQPLLAAQIGSIFGHGTGAAERQVFERALFAGMVPAGLMEEPWVIEATESLRAGIELQSPPRFDLAPLRAMPCRVIGAEADTLIPPAFVRATGDLLSAPATIVPAMGHAVMLEPEWPMVADLLLDWLRGPDLTHTH